MGARGSVAGWGTMLQAGRSPVRVPDEVGFFNLSNSSCRTMALGSTEPIKWVPEIFLGVKNGRRVGLTTLSPSVSRMSENVGASTSRNPKGLYGLYRDNLTVSYIYGANISVTSLLPIFLKPCPSAVSCEFQSNIMKTKYLKQSVQIALYVL
jgi:hypothetical protein